MIAEIPVIFPSAGTILAGRFVRNTPDLTTRQTGVVVTGSWLKRHASNELCGAGCGSLFELAASEDRGSLCSQR